MAGIQDRLNDLSWLGENFADQGWFAVGEPTEVPRTAEEINETIAQMLENTAWAVDNTAMTKAERAAWLNFREALKAIPLQAEFPTNVVWPTEPA